MLTKLRLHNFKSFRDTGEIDIKPFTVLAGPNSSGKSSILQSLLLLKQSLETENPEIQLNLDGQYLQFSSLSELTFGKPQLNRAKVSYEFQMELDIPVREVRRHYPDMSIPDDIENLTLCSSVSFSFKRAQAIKKVIFDPMEIKTYVNNILGPQSHVTFKGGKTSRYKVTITGHGLKLPRPYRDYRILSVATNHFIPGFYVLESKVKNIESELDAILPVHPIFFNTLQNLVEELENLRYLGPLREVPRRAYLHSGNPFTEIGQKGEYAAQILWLEKDTKVDYVPSYGQNLEEIELHYAVSDVFERIGISQTLNVRSLKSIMYQIMLGISGTKSKKEVTIADVGFGVSQLLPIVVMGLLSPESSILLFEQPEIHLHPRIQANLADFFLSLVTSGKRIIVETHSDHFINRLRRRIAEDTTDELKEKVNILFVNSPKNGAGSFIEPLSVDRYGIIENWPPDFLPESSKEAEAIFRAGLEKRQNKAK